MYPHDCTPISVLRNVRRYRYVQLYVTAAVRVVTRPTMGINVCFNGRTFRPESACYVVTQRTIAGR